MLVSKDAGEQEQEQDVAKTNQPVCPNCGAARECVLEQIPSPASYILSIFSIYYFGIWSMFIIPLIFQSTKIIVKRCYFCNVEIESRRLFQIPNINDKVLQFKFGGCMIVISRKYAIILLMIIIGLFFYVEYNKEPPIQEVKVFTSKSWVEFLSLCGKFQFVDNGLKARHQFEENFKNKFVRWTGDYIQTKRNLDMHYPYDYWIYVKMVPTESAQDYPDIILGVIKSHIQQEILQKLKVGQPIEFEAKFLQLGSEYQQHLMELEWLHMENKPVEDINNLEKFTINLERTRRGYPNILRDSIKKVIHNYKDFKKDYKGKIKRLDLQQNTNVEIVEVPKVDFQNVKNSEYDHLNNIIAQEQIVVEDTQDQKQQQIEEIQEVNNNQEDIQKNKQEQQFEQNKQIQSESQEQVKLIQLNENENITLNQYKNEKLSEQLEQNVDQDQENQAKNINGSIEQDIIEQDIIEQDIQQEQYLQSEQNQQQLDNDIPFKTDNLNEKLNTDDNNNGEEVPQLQNEDQ